MAENKEKGLKSREKAILKGCFGALVLLGGYLAGSLILAPKTEEITKNNVALEKEVNELKQASLEKAETQKNLEKMEKSIKDILSKYPSDFTFEKTVEFITATLNEKFPVGITNISYEDNGEFYKFESSKGASGEGTGTVSSVTITAEYATSYDEFKKIVKFINEEISTRATINEFNMSGNVEKAVVAVEGEISFVVYYGMGYSKYKEPNFDVNLGRNNIFLKK